MKIMHLSDAVRGWFCGDFEPSIYKTSAVEVGIKNYKAGYHENPHYHKVSTEITTIISGEVKINNTTYVAGDIILIEPMEIVDFISVTDSITNVVKIPHTKNDKYEV